MSRKDVAALALAVIAALQGARLLTGADSIPTGEGGATVQGAIRREAARPDVVGAEPDEAPRVGAEPDRADRGGAARPGGAGAVGTNGTDPNPTGSGMTGAGDMRDAGGPGIRASSRGMADVPGAADARRSDDRGDRGDQAEVGRADAAGATSWLHHLARLCLGPFSIRNRSVLFEASGLLTGDGPGGRAKGGC